MLKKIALVACVALAPSLAQAEADGPDAWRVIGVKSWDTLSVRMGPGTRYIKIGQLPYNARHLRYTECVPYLNAGIWENLTPYQRDNLPQRWCWVHDYESGVKGWVAGKYLGEDVLD